MGDGAEIVGRVYAAKVNSLAANEIIKDYLPFIKSEACKATGRIVVEGVDDEVSIAMIAFHGAIEGYSKTKGAFLNYAALLIKRKLIDYYRKEKRHFGIASIDTPIGEDEQMTVGDTIEDESNPYEETAMRDATREEITELTAQLSSFGVSLTDIADSCPKQSRTLETCRSVLQYARENPDVIDELKRTKRLPVARLIEGTGVERKTLERHRKYILALLVIYSNGYEIIRGHLKQVLGVTKGGEGK